MEQLANAMAAQIAAHLLGVEAGAAALVVAGIFAIPEKFPTSVQEWWTWFRDTLQGAVPMKMVKHVNLGAPPDSRPLPTPPAGPVEEK